MNEQPIRKIRPVVVPSDFFTFGLMHSLYSAVICALLGPVLLMSFKDIVLGYDDYFSSPYGFASVFGFGFIGFAAVMGFYYLKIFVEPKQNIYRIYSDRIEYELGLLDRRSRTLMFDQIIDMTLSESLLQQRYDAGSIAIVVAIGYKGRLSNRTIMLANLSQPREVYELLKSLTTKRDKTSQL